MAASSLVEIDSLEVVVIVDNEVDPISSYHHPDLQVSGQMASIALKEPLDSASRGGASHEIRLDNLCCGAHGLSLMIVRNYPSPLL
jgi:7,8-dihydropterin-6-yl-methyl-4-(beta-D-ribofuranosyl)aminobenzene 5'-phosphate synthase